MPKNYPKINQIGSENKAKITLVGKLVFLKPFLELSASEVTLTTSAFFFSKHLTLQA